MIKEREQAKYDTVTARIEFSHEKLSFDQRNINYTILIIV